LARCYRIPIYVRPDDQEAFKWMHRAALNGLESARLQLGTYYRDGIGVAVDYEKAIQFWSLSGQGSCSLLYLLPGMGAHAQTLLLISFFKTAGNGDGENLIGHYYETIAQDREMAYHHYLRSAEMKSETGAFNLATCYRIGFGTSVNDALAFQYMMQSADSGFARARFEIGNYYRYFHSFFPLLPPPPQLIS
jgi:TPR repeat protein